MKTLFTSLLLTITIAAHINGTYSSRDLGEALVEAVKNDDVARVRRLLTYKNINVNFYGEGYFKEKTALHIATEKNNLEIVQILLAHPQIDLNIDESSRGLHKLEPVLHIAIQNNNLEIVHALLAHPDIHVNIRDNIDDDALLIATNGEKLGIMRALLAHPKIWVNDGYYISPLQTASNNGSIEAVNMLLAHKDIDINKKNSYSGSTALHFAAERKHLEIVKILLADPRINVNIPDAKGKTALYEATSKGHKEIVQTLLAHPNIDVNIQDLAGVTALCLAVQSGHQEMVRMLREAGASSFPTFNRAINFIKNNPQLMVTYTVATCAIVGTLYYIWSKENNDSVLESDQEQSA